MRFFYGKQQLSTLDRAQEENFLLTNGLGGYASVTSGYGVNRCDMGILVAAVKAPNERITMVHRLRECLTLNKKEYWLSTQNFADETEAEETVPLITKPAESEITEATTRPPNISRQ